MKEIKEKIDKIYQFYLQGGDRTHKELMILDSFYRAVIEAIEEAEGVMK